MPEPAGSIGGARSDAASHGGTRSTGPFDIADSRTVPPTVVPMNTIPGTKAETSKPLRHPGDRVGVYLLVRRLGGGGFGEVWEAERRDPHLRVAIKFIRPDRVNSNELDRFKLEREILAKLNHECIAKVFDAGVDDGSPYIVMELVEGVHLNKYCDTEGLTIPARLELLARVCDAIHYAHNKTILHLDLSPDNILVVAKPGAKPIPKIVDFGIARVTDPDAGMPRGARRDDSWIGKPEYMAPEQFDHNPDLDARADVYALGVILFQLVTGTVPIDRDTLLRTLREDGEHASTETSVDPAARFSQLEEGQKTLAATNRGDLSPRVLESTLRGRLRCLTHKALEHTRRKRFASAEALATDIRNYVEKREFAAAGPESWVQRAGLFVDRNRVGVTLGAAAALVLVGVMVWALAQRASAVQAKAEMQTMLTELQSKNKDLEAANEKARLAVKAAEEAQRSTQMALAAVEQKNRELEKERANTETANQKAKDLERELQEANQRAEKPRPADENKGGGEDARVASTAGQTSPPANASAEAIERLQRRLKLDRQALARDPNRETLLSVLVSLQKLAEAQGSAGDSEGALEARREALKFARQLRDEYPDPLSKRNYMVSLGLLGELETRSGHPKEARQHLQDSYDLAKQYSEAEPAAREPAQDLAVALTRLGTLELLDGNQAKADTYLGKALDVCEALYKKYKDGEARDTLSATLVRLGNLKVAQEDVAGARKLYQRSVQLDEDARKEEDNLETRRSLSVSLDRLGELELGAGNLDEAQKILERALKLDEQNSKEDPSRLNRMNLAISYSKLGTIDLKREHWKDSKAWFMKSREVLESVLEKSDAAAIHHELFSVHQALFLIALKTNDVEFGADVMEDIRRTAQALVRLNDLQPDERELLTTLEIKLDEPAKKPEKDR